MIVSAISLWKKYNLNNPLNESVWGEETRGDRYYCHVSYFGHKVVDGSVRIYARFAKPAKKDGRLPTILLLPDVGEMPNTDLMEYFVDKGYAVLMPDYSGKMSGDSEDVMRTVYPTTIAYGNYEKAKGLQPEEGFNPEESTWFEWAYVALYSVQYLKARQDVENIGVVGIRTGGELAWYTMPSPDVKCGIPINAIGWGSSLDTAKFGDAVPQYNDDRHRYIAAVEAQSYAPYANCPVLMLCALRDKRFDCDRAYDTYVRMGNHQENAMVYAVDSGACIGPQALTDMTLFLQKHLLGREIFTPEIMNVALKETDDGLDIEVNCDERGILEEAGIFYAEADVKTKSTYRDWRCIYKTTGRDVKNGRFKYSMKPFGGASAVFAFAYARYFNGFCVASKITSKRLLTSNPYAIRSRVIFRGSDIDGFGVAQYENYSVGDIFLEQAAVPKTTYGYGNIAGVYSVGGFRTYKISSPRYLPMDNALLEFEIYSKTSQDIRVTIEVADVDKSSEKYSTLVYVRGGGKWKRMILKASDFKGETYGRPLESFNRGSALVFSAAAEGEEYSVTNILWL